MSAVALHEPETQRRDVARLPSVGTGFFDLQSFELTQRVARCLASSSLVPKIYQGNTPEAVGNCMIAINFAQRVKADPLMVMQNLNVIQGRPSWSSPFLIALVNTCGRFTELDFEFSGEPGTDSHGCRASAASKTTGKTLVGAEITIKMAKDEGWYGRNGSKWRTMPQQMLIYRAAAFWARVYAPELSMGLMTAEEAEDIIDLEPSAYREVTPAKGRSRPRAAVPANDIATVDARAEENEQPCDAPAVITEDQVAELTALAFAVRANYDKFCEWLGVASFADIPATEFDKAKRALEAKRRKAEQSTSAADIPPPAAETPADPQAGEPASSVPPLDDAGPTQAELKQEAYEAGRDACEAGVDFKDVPEKYRNHAFQRKAWKDGYQAFAAEAGA